MTSQDNLFIFSSISDFDQGTHDGTCVTATDEHGPGGVVALRDGVIRGVYTSPGVATRLFDYMILSWNAETPDGAYVEIEGRVRASGQWSQWLSWGCWSTSSFVDELGETAMPGSAPGERREDALAKVDPDELKVKGSPGQVSSADRFQYRLVPHRGAETSPVMSLVACSIKNAVGQPIAKAGLPDLTHLDLDLVVPAYSQYQQDSKIAPSICSPTSMAMVMTYHGVPVSPEDSARGVRDHTVPMFGNWPFNTAFVGSRGFTSYVDYMVPAEGDDPWGAVKQEIADGNPVVVSVRYRKPGYEDGKYKEPEVEGVPINRTPGHLVVVRGFTWRNDVEYVVVNDPAGATDGEVRRLYRADQFFRAWVKKVAYVVHKR